MIPPFRLSAKGVEPDHYSPSQLDAFTLCGLRWANSRIKAPIPSYSVDAFRGVVVDHVISYAVRNACSDHEKLAVIFASKIAEDAAKVRGNLLTLDAMRANWLPLIFAFVDIYMLEFDIKPENVQRPLEREYNGMKIVGTPDLISEYGPIDIKTHKSLASMRMRQYETDMQVSTYAWMLEPEIGYIPAGIILALFETGKQRAEMIIVRTDRVVPSLLDRYERMHRAINHDCLMPAATSHPLCSSSYCTFYNDCPHGARLQGINDDDGSNGN